MKTEFDNYEILKLRWETLTEETINENKFDREEFVSLFKETFEEIKKYSIASTIDRDIMDLIFIISGFVATRHIKISPEYAAAIELTDAMLHCCLYEDPHENIITKGEWYIFSDISLDFTKPDEMLFNIATDLEQWDDIATE